MRQEQGRADEAVRALCMPYLRDTYGLSRLITVSRNRCSTTVSCAGHVVPKLVVCCMGAFGEFGSGWRVTVSSPELVYVALAVSMAPERITSQGPAGNSGSMVVHWTGDAWPGMPGDTAAARGCRGCFR